MLYSFLRIKECYELNYLNSENKSKSANLKKCLCVYVLMEFIYKNCI